MLSGDDPSDATTTLGVGVSRGSGKTISGTGGGGGGGGFGVGNEDSPFQSGFDPPMHGPVPYQHCFSVLPTTHVEQLG